MTSRCSTCGDSHICSACLVAREAKGGWLCPICQCVNWLIDGEWSEKGYCQNYAFCARFRSNLIAKTGMIPRPEIECALAFGPTVEA